jgi:hypothetical protein
VAISFIACFCLSFIDYDAVDIGEKDMKFVVGRLRHCLDFFYSG